MCSQPPPATGSETPDPGPSTCSARRSSASVTGSASSRTSGCRSSCTTAASSDTSTRREAAEAPTDLVADAHPSPRPLRHPPPPSLPGDGGMSTAGHTARGHPCRTTRDRSTVRTGETSRSTAGNSRNRHGRERRDRVPEGAGSCRHQTATKASPHPCGNQSQRAASERPHVRATLNRPPQGVQRLPLPHRLSRYVPCPHTPRIMQTMRLPMRYRRSSLA